MFYSENPTWVDKILRERFERISRVIRPEWLPVSIGKRSLKFKEYGCGHYGCVMPTSDEDVVFKITTDASEAAFVCANRELAKSGDLPDGMIEYYDIYELPDTFKRRRVFCVTRHSAENVGDVFKVVKERARDFEVDFIKKESDRFFRMLYEFKRYSGWIRQKFSTTRNVYNFIQQIKRYKNHAFSFYERARNDGLTVWRYSFGMRAEQIRDSFLKCAVYLLVCSEIASAMTANQFGERVGVALGEYLSEYILLADVHQDNIGEIYDRDAEMRYVVITDPGHMVPLDEKWLQVAVPILP